MSDINNSQEGDSRNNARRSFDANSEDHPSGWITKRCKRRNKWKKKFFTFKDNTLVYGNSEVLLHV